LKILSLCPASFASNCYALISGDRALVVDPSISCEAIMNAVAAEGAVIDGIILTHGHFDHIISVDTLRKNACAPVMIHKEDAEMLGDGHKNAFFTFFGRDMAYAPADKLLSDGDKIKVGEEELEVIHTPGHSKGSVCYLVGNIMITGDTLFSDNVGRCDLYGGSDSLLRDSLSKLSGYDPKIKIYPGHGQSALLRDALDNVAYFR